MSSRAQQHADVKAKTPSHLGRVPPYLPVTSIAVLLAVVVSLSVYKTSRLPPSIKGRSDEPGQEHRSSIVGQDLYLMSMRHMEMGSAITNLQMALSYSRKAAELGHAKACVLTGQLLSSGALGYRDDAAAAKWFEKGAELGDIQAQFEIGRCYAAGLGVPQVAEESGKWLREAAESGHAEAQVLWGNYLDKRPGIPNNHGQAVEWYRRAASQGSAQAYCWLGHAFLTGRGVRRDLVEAYRCYFIASQNGSEAGSKSLAELEESMSRRELEKARAKARETSGLVSPALP